MPELFSPAMNALMVALLFFLVALVYSMAGFGGGSSYIALLVILQAPCRIIPVVALICNIVVVTTGMINYIRYGHFSWKLTAPFALTSMPCSYLAGSAPISKELFLWVLGCVLLAAGIRMLIMRDSATIDGRELKSARLWTVGPFAGALLGGVSGLVGIGGGIFLSPLLHSIGWGKPKQIAATASVFIFLNSCFGLIGQLQKAPDFTGLGSYLLLPVVVLIGGFTGSFIGARKLDQKKVLRVTAVIVLIAAARILAECV